MYKEGKINKTIKLTMNKIYKYATLFVAACAMTVGTVSCSSDKDDIDVDNAADLDYSSDYAEQWANYMTTVSSLLKTDAQTLYDKWNSGYAATFKNHNSTEYASAINCVEQILDGCSEIANEVGDAKIGDPYAKYTAGNKTEALYAVESWYSWHSREDYRNNIYSIRNAYYGTRDGSISANSLSAVLATKDAELDSTAKALIQNAADAIWDIPQPFRNNINTEETRTAMNACSELTDFIDQTLKPYFQANINDEETLDPVIAQYVDEVVMPTYKELAEKNAALHNTVLAFKANPSDDAFAECAKAWLAARTPWETSEAFLFGPVDEFGLDPNMDSWPLDQKQIVSILKSQDFTNLNWDEDQSDDKIEASQSLRGFHTLEYLIFKDGKARTVK